MRISSTSTTIPHRCWLTGALFPLVLTACATVRPADDARGRVQVGYGEVDQEHIDGSVETVKGEEELSEGARTLADMLRGTPGLQVWEQGDDLVVRIRGGSSFLASEQPLVVVDRMEYRGALRSLNPYDIDTIRVLKNAGDTAIYGARGANGVILITTKSGPRWGGAN
jgi:TonB-dependent SusC/RagA subfamily outer membrane receptor